ncbi:22f3762a-707d-4647-a701-3096f5458ba0, partial [Thermothielavioides terrestris]
GRRADDRKDLAAPRACCRSGGAWREALVADVVAGKPPSCTRPPGDAAQHGRAVPGWCHDRVGQVRRDPLCAGVYGHTRGRDASHPGVLVRVFHGGTALRGREGAARRGSKILALWVRAPR